jgi:peptidoglycan-associated lipoprotein
MFRTVSYGEERPIAQGSNESAWAENRRDEFVLPNTAALLK